MVFCVCPDRCTQIKAVNLSPAHLIYRMVERYTGRLNRTTESKLSRVSIYRKINVTVSFIYF